MSGAGLYTSRKYVTGELLAKLNTLLGIMRKSQPPVDPTVNAINQKIDQTLKQKPNDPFIRAQLLQSLNDKQQLYDMCQGKVNPFKTSEAVDSITQTTTTHSGKSDSEMLAEMLRMKAMFEQRGRKKKQRVVSSYKAPYSSVYS